MFITGFPLPEDYVYNEDAILEYIKLVDKKFQLVIILEYLPESLLLLKRMLGWSIKGQHLKSAQKFNNFKQ